MSTTRSLGTYGPGGSYTVWDELRAEIEVQRQLIRCEFDEFAPSLAAYETREPTGVEMRALGAMLQSVYTGIENQLERISRVIEGAVPSGESWHRELLDGMAAATDDRPAVIPESAHVLLLDLLRFRHLFRHSYSHVLRWDRMRDLVLGVADTVDLVDRGIDAFLASLDDAPDA